MTEKQLLELDYVNEFVVEIYYTIDEETDEVIFDEDSMREEFEYKMNKLLAL